MMSNLKLPQGAIVTGRIEIVTYIDPANDDDYMIAAIAEDQQGKNMPLLTSYGMLELSKGLLLEANDE